MLNINLTDKFTGRRILPLHGVNAGPLTHNLTRDCTALFRDARIPYARLHDIEYPLGCGHFVDIHCVFPRFEDDPSNPDSYDFFYTDKYIAGIQSSGCEAFYRLGETIDHSPNKRYVVPPADYDKWAAICEGIIRHYNEGWADGYHYNLKYWEIWNEPENPPMWTGTREQYLELYRVTANRLKNRFPDIKVGGYASCGFYSLTREKQDELQKTFIPYLEDFFKYIKSQNTKAPLDFMSWHIYTDNPDEMRIHARFARKILDDNGFASTESILDEWNYGGQDMFVRMRNEIGASFAASCLIEMQSAECAVDKAMFYDAQPDQEYGGLFIRHTANPSKTYYALKAFSELYILGNETIHEVGGEKNEKIRVLSASDGINGAAIAVNYSDKAEEAVISVEEVEKNLEVYILDRERELVKYAGIKGRSIELKLPAYSVVLVKYN